MVTDKRQTAPTGARVRMRTLSADRFTPCGLARKLSAQVLLESASFRSGRQRYSILMIEPALRVIQAAADGGVQLLIDGKVVEYPQERGARDMLDALAYFAGQHDTDQFSFPVPYGGVGFLSYEFATLCDTIRVPEKDDPLGLPLGNFILGHQFIVFDHYTDTLQLVGLNYREHEIDLDKALDATEAKINDLDFNYLLPDTRDYPVHWPEDDGREHFCQMVESVRGDIIAGNLLQALPSRRVSVKSDLPAFTAYSRLRHINPSPYLFYLDFDDYQLFGASPEVHVRVRDGEVLIRPLAGTRRRGKDAEEDRGLADELLADPKERAEHLMLVDLARNDLGRVCAPGSITVTQLEDIERYARVMHIVSEITGKIETGRNAADAIRATFPAGTVSGAPKIRAIETVAKLEKIPRRFYAGLVGYMQSEHAIDTCITIRSCLAMGGQLHVQAGAGVVYDSTPTREYTETGEKLQSVVEAISSGGNRV